MTAVRRRVNLAAHAMSGRRMFGRVSNVREGLGWLDFHSSFTHHTLTLLGKVLTKDKSESLACNFVTIRELPNHMGSTRRDHLLALPRIRGAPSEAAILLSRH